MVALVEVMYGRGQGCKLRVRLVYLKRECDSQEDTEMKCYDC